MKDSLDVGEVASDDPGMARWAGLWAVGVLGFNMLMGAVEWFVACFSVAWIGVSPWDVMWISDVVVKDVISFGS